MELPDRLDYDVDGSWDDEGDYEWPMVHCRVPDCPWLRGSSWSDLAADGDVDWDVEHPAHDEDRLPPRPDPVHLPQLVLTYWWGGQPIASVPLSTPVLRNGDTLSITPGSITISAS